MIYRRGEQAQSETELIAHLKETIHQVCFKLLKGKKRHHKKIKTPFERGRSKKNKDLRMKNIKLNFQWVS